MLSSLPPLFPHDPHTLWYPSLSTHPPPHNQTTPDTNNGTPHHQHPQRHQHAQPPQRTLLSVLRADENTVLHRKANIRRFGAGWLRPPGVSKTLQGMVDERAEREDADNAREREFALASAQAAAQEMAGAEGEGGEDLAVEGAGEEGEERDLDEEVPDAEADGEAEWSDEDGEDEDMEGGEEGMGMEEEGDGDYGPTVVTNRGEGSGDLDDEIPEAEAGSYEHTDTEVEDESSEDEGGRVSGSAFGQARLRGDVVARDSGVLGSSVFGSSPVRNRDVGRSGRGRENYDR
ncbi:hypothetical protein MMC28_010002 [Mycoblastus sanguinarius]|nr:hypothetical protein [Mycoblastus sanguinarius]